MQIDLHYGLTYVLSRLAGFEKESAFKIAYSAQYVDDATNSGLIRFDNGSLYKRISSAHLPTDLIHNASDIKNHLVWIPFHFLPGNLGHASTKQEENDFIEKIICKPNSEVAKDMVRACLKSQEDVYFLHRLGVSMHVYIDTWSHREFCGVLHDVNKVFYIEREGFQWKELEEKITSKFVSGFFPLGHGGALSYPDYPFLKWNYTNGRGEKIVRDNSVEFIEASKWVYSALSHAKQGETNLQLIDMNDDDLAQLANLFQTLEHDEGEERLGGWAESIRNGSFSFGAEEIPAYIPKGEGSWKHKALGTLKEVDDLEEVFIYDKSFLESDWKHFHDAIQDHRFTVIHKILPKYGICVS